MRPRASDSCPSASRRRTALRETRPARSDTGPAGTELKRSDLLLESLQPDVFRAAEPFPEPLQTVNCYLVAGDDGCVLIDTGFAPGREGHPALDLLAYAGRRAQDVTAIVLTHCHHDHSGDVRHVQEMTGAPVLMHESELMTLAEAAELAVNLAPLSLWLESHGAPQPAATEMAGSFRWRAPQDIGSRHLLRGGESISTGATELRFVHTPGHSPGHLCVHLPGRDLLVTGDQLLPNESTNISVRPNQPYDPLGSYLDGLAAVKRLAPGLCLPGHGEPFTNVDELVDGQMRHHEQRLDDVRSVVETRPSTAFEVAAEIPWVRRSKRLAHLDPRHRFLALGETIAHLERLEALGVIRRRPGPPVGWVPAG